MKRFTIFFLFVVLFSLSLGTGTSYAYTDDARLLGTLEDTQGPIYDYLNANNFHFYNKENYTYAYIQNDNSLFILITDGLSDGYFPLIGHNGWLGGIIFLKPGHKTNKGIAVGMKLKDLVNAYGPIYPMNRSDIYDNDINTGCYHEGSYTYKSSWGGERTFSYYEIAYRDRNSRQINFLVDKSSNKIRAINFHYVRLGMFMHSPSLWLSSWGLWRFVLPEMNDNPIKSAWNAIEGIFKK